MALPEVDQLRCFLAAAEARNFRRAAAAVHLTPAAVGKQIRRLEERVGVPLFVRTTRQVQLTRRGEELVSQARTALAALAVCAAPEESRTALMGQLTLGTRHELGLSWLAPWALKLAHSHPDLHLNFYVGAGNDLLLRVRSGQLDCAVTSTRFSEPALQYEPLHEETYCLVAAKELLRKLPLRTAEDASKHTLLDVSAELPLFRYWLDGSPPPRAPRFGRTSHLGTIAVIREYVLAKRGVAVLPTYYVREDLRQRRLVVPFPNVKPAKDWFRLVFRRNDSRPNLFRELAESLRREPLR